MSNFQTGGVKGKGVTDNLFMLRGMIDYCNYLGKELWISFYDIEKCFDSLWLEDYFIMGPWSTWCALYLIYLLNKCAEIQIKTPAGITDPIFLRNVVKQRLQ